MKESTNKKDFNRYVYPAIFTYELGQEIAVDFPDLGAATSGIDENDALLSARELLGMVLHGMEEDEETIPEPTSLADIQLKDNEHAVFVDAHM